MTNTEKFLESYVGPKNDEVGEFLEHWGVPGMRWGYRKDRSGKHRPTDQVLADQKRRRKEQAKLDRQDRRDQRRQERRDRKADKKNGPQSSFTPHENQNRGVVSINSKGVIDLSQMSDADLKDFVGRLRLEQDLRTLLAGPPPPPEAQKRTMKTLLKNVAMDSVQQGTTAASRKAIEKALTVIFNNMVGSKSAFRL